jgi:hypothetical protein
MFFLIADNVYKIYFNFTIVKEANNFIDAMECSIGLYIIFNTPFPQKMAAFLEFIFRYY